MQVPETEVIATGVDGGELLRAVLRPGEYFIGRNPDCELRIEADLVSRKHALLTINFDHALIEDLGSSNGTSINGQPVKEPTRLWPNQKIQLGTATLELHRIKTVPPPDVSLAPSTAAVRRILPEEFLRDKKYDIGGVVAQGGMGAILDAKETTIERKVAMKVMLDGSSPDDLTRFIGEAKITGQLEHPNIVPVHELGVDENDQVFYTMKFVRGVTLRKVLELMTAGTEATIRKYPLGALLTIFQKVCDALAFAHSKGVIHRDLKPENIMLGDFGEVLLMDWGLAKLLRRDTPAGAPNGEAIRSAVQTVPLAETDGSGTIDGSIMGTPYYMSPEQARGEIDVLDARTDVYALGAILFHLLYLQMSVSGNSVGEIVEKVKAGALDWPDRKAASAKKLTHLPGGSVPDSLRAVCRKALALDPGKRYASVADLQKDIAAYQTGFATSAENAGLFRQIDLALRRHKKEAVILTVAAALLLSGGIYAFLRVHRERDVAVAQRSRADAALADLKKTAPSMLALAASEAAFQRYDSALEKIAAALALDPALTAAYWRRGWIFLAQEKLPEALDALHLAQSKDPANRRFAELVPLVEKMAAAPENARHSTEIIRPIYARLAEAGATGESTPFVRYLKQTKFEDYKLVQARLEQWLGKPQPGEKPPFLILIETGSYLRVRIDNVRVGTLEPLRGLPIEALDASGCGITSLEPLRGMHLVRLTATDDPIHDLEPLRSMPLEYLNLGRSQFTEISPLVGMRLKELSLNEVNVTDLRPISGMPLEYLALYKCPATDFSALRGMPLRELAIASTSFSDGRILTGMPLEKLGVSGRFTDLASLEGLPLRDLSVRPLGFPISDSTPLLRVPSLERLNIVCDLKTLLPLRDHPGLKEIYWNNTGFRPVADFWRDYDAQQAAQKE